MSSSNEIKWLWRMTLSEKFYEPYSTSYRLAIATARPLLEKQIDLALRHLFRKVPTLRVCIAEKDGERWLREMTDEIIDLEMLEGGDTFELLSGLQQYKFNKTSGPLWCVKVKPGEMESDSEFKHVYDLFLGSNHIITDGSSNMKICGLLIQLLDAVIAGTNVDDSEQVGVFLSGDKTQGLIQEKLAVLKADPDLHARLKAEYEVLQRPKSLYKSTYKGMEGEVAQTRIVTRDLDSETSTALIRRCRAEGVTFNSAFTALSNLALVDLLIEGGLLQDSYSLRSDHVLNARRYWGGDASNVLGCHLLSLMPLRVETSRNAKENLWSYVKLINEELQGKFKSAKPVMDEAVKLSIPDAYVFEMDFCVTNMGDVTQTFKESGEHVRILHLLRSAAIHTTPQPLSQFIHTLRGRLTYSLMYNTTHTQPGTAKRYVDILFDYFYGALQK